jgi:hypothetical protein
VLKLKLDQEGISGPRCGGGFCDLLVHPAGKVLAERLELPLGDVPG